MAEEKRNKRDSMGDGIKKKSITFSKTFLCFPNQSLGSEAGWWG